jgi:tubulin beta
MRIWRREYQSVVRLGVELLPESMDTIRKTAEECDLVHGFQFLHSISGGTGGGLGSLLIDRIREEYSDRLIQSYSICPALPLSQVVVRHQVVDR